MNSWKTSLVVACAVICFAPLSALAQAAAPAPNLEEALKQATTYEFGQSRECLSQVEDAVRQSLSSPDASKAVAARLAQYLGSEATLSSKQFMCRQLAIIGNAETVPALAALLAKDDTADMARIALERIPAPEADMALLTALLSAEGKTKVGIINSLGERRTPTAVAPLAGFAGGGDRVADAAISALGKIGTADAAKVLEGLLLTASPEFRTAVADAYLLCADQTIEAGQADAASAMYEKIYNSEQPWNVRIAAFHGLVASKGEAAVPLVIAAISGSDPALASAATGFVREIPGASVTQAFVAQLPSLTPAVQSLILNALGDRGDKAALPAVVAALKADDETIRAAAMSAAAKLGDASTVPVLLDAAVSASGQDLKAARDSLAKLRGADVDAAMIALVPQAGVKARAELIRALAERNTTSAVPTFLQTAKDADADVRKESFKALAAAAAPDQLPAIVQLLVENPADARDAAKTVVAVASRIPDANQRAAAALAVYSAQQDANVKAVLLDVFSQLGDNTALDTLRAELKNPDAAVKDAAVRALTSWPNAAALQDAFAVAEQGESDTHKLLALRGALRMLALPSDRAKADTIALYEKALTLSTKADEKRAALSGLGDLADTGAVRLVQPYLADAEVQAEAKQAMAKLLKTLSKYEASADADNVAKAADNNPDTRWTSGAMQKGGEWFLVDMTVEATVTKTTLDSTGSAADFPRGYEVYVSNDKANWGDAVAKGTADKPVVTIDCAPKAGRYVKIVQTGTAPDNYWSIHELSIETQ